MGKERESGYVVKGGHSYFKEPWVSPPITLLRDLDFEAPELFIFGTKEATLAVELVRKKPFRRVSGVSARKL